MASSFEKSVKGATKIKLAPPKTKYIEHILLATRAGDAGVGEVFRALQYRLRDTAWTTVFKSLITVHLMIREGEPDATLNYLAKHRNALVTTVIDAQTQGRNIRHYANYLTERGRAYRDTKIDWVQVRESRLEKLSVEKGLLRETEAVQHQLTALLKCDVMEEDSGNDITIFVFRLLVLDLLALFQVLNLGMINILGHFFEMSKVDAERAMQIYLNFTRQTDFVVQYLSIARQYEHQTRVKVPKLKHAPVNLGRQLQDYLHDPEFEVHRRRYLAELDAKKGGSSRATKSDTASKNTPARSNTTAASNTASTSKPAQPAAKGPDPDLIDFFGAIEQNQTPMGVQPSQPQQMQMQTGANPWGASVAGNGAAAGMFNAQPTGVYQQNGFATQQMPQQVPQQMPQQMAQQTGFQSTNPFQMQATGAFAQSQQQQPQQQQQQQQQLQPAFTGMGFGGFTPQQQQQSSFQPSGLSAIPQNSAASFQQQPQQQQFPTSQPGLAPPQLASPTGQVTNPFRQSLLVSNQTGFQGNNSLFSSTQPAPAAPLVAQQTSTNPFARASPQTTQPFGTPSSTIGSTPAPLVATKTGTNPFAKDYGGTAAAQQAQRPVTAGGGFAASNPLAPQATGTTNPFRQTAFVDHQTGLGWQHQQPTGNLLDQVETVPVFPRPAPQAPWH